MLRHHHMKLPVVSTICYDIEDAEIGSGIGHEIELPEDIMMFTVLDLRIDVYRKAPASNDCIKRLSLCFLEDGSKFLPPRKKYKLVVCSNCDVGTTSLYLGTVSIDDYANKNRLYYSIFLEEI